MRLRNKKTGEVVVEINKIGLVWNKYGMPAEIGQYDSIAELNEEWEDVEPKEPSADETASWLKSENENLRSEIAYLGGKIGVYEKFLKDRGYIKEEK